MPRTDSAIPAAEPSIEATDEYLQDKARERRDRSVSRSGNRPGMTKTSVRLTATVAELARHVGARLGPSRWVTIDQPMIDQFAALTGDDHWIHVDPARARRELPSGKTIAHGYLTLALVTRLMGELLDIRFTRALNYGHDRLRFTGAVPAGARVRLRATILRAEPVKDGGVRLTTECTMEIEGEARPALVAETIAVFYP